MRRHLPTRPCHVRQPSRSSKLWRSASVRSRRICRLWRRRKQPPLIGGTPSRPIRTSRKRKQTTSRSAQAKRRFRVTHPFHPWFGREFEYEDDRERFGHRRLFYRLDNGQIAYFLTRWTDQAAKDPFVEMAGGRALARPRDLLELAELALGLVRNV